MDEDSHKWTEINSSLSFKCALCVVVKCTVHIMKKISNYLEVKSNRLKGKEASFESYKHFFTRSINEGQVPKRLELMLGSTIDNYDQVLF